MDEVEKKPDDPPIEEKVEHHETEITAPSNANIGSGEDENYESADENGHEEIGEEKPGSPVEDVKEAEPVEANEEKEPEKAAEKDEGKEEPKEELKEDDAASTSSESTEHEMTTKRRRSEGSEADDHDSIDQKKKESVEETDEEEGDIHEDEAHNGDTEEPQTPAVQEPEDRKNPAFVPRRGVFYQHDTRASDEPESKPNERQSKKLIMMEQQQRWQHDMFDENEQMPKGRHELVNAYGYDIRGESKAPRDPHGRRYGRSQNTRDNESQGRRPFGGYRRSFGGGRRGGDRGRGGYAGHNHRDENVEHTTPVRESPSNSPNGDDSKDKDLEKKGNNAWTAGVARSRSFSDAERGGYENARPYNSYRGGRQQGGSGMQKQSYGTVVFRRGRGAAFAGDQKNNQFGRNYDNSRNSAEDQSGHGHGDYSGSEQQPFRSQRQHEAPRRGHCRPTRGYSHGARDYEGDDRRQYHHQQQQQHSTSNDVRQHQQSWDQGRSMNAGAASTKRYSAIRQQVQPANSQKMTMPSQDGAAVSPQMAFQQPMMAQPPNIEQPMYATGPPPPVHYPPFFNGSGMYHQQQAVPVAPEVYPIPVPFAADAANAYVLPPPFIGQQQYPPTAAYQTVTPAVYAADTGGGRTVYFDADSQHRQQHAYGMDKKRRPKSIPIVSPEQVETNSKEEKANAQ